MLALTVGKSVAPLELIQAHVSRAFPGNISSSTQALESAALVPSFLLSLLLETALQLITILVETVPEWCTLQKINKRTFLRCLKNTAEVYEITYRH